MDRPQMQTVGTSQGTASDRFRDLIRSLTGINLPPGKVPMIEQRLRRRVLAHELPDTEAYLRKLLEGALKEDELRIVIDLITTNTTSFFRESDHFTYLRDHILPEHLTKSAPNRARLKVWSAASSEGAEAFTIAMVLAEAQRSGRAFDWAVLGTDISIRILEKAQSAVYDVDQLQTVPSDLARRYFLYSDDPALARKARVIPDLRRRVQFRRLNLMDKTYPVDRDVNVIFLRNVLIYFEPADQLRVIERMVGHLVSGGCLFVGHSESMVVRHPLLAQIAPAVYRKV